MKATSLASSRGFSRRSRLGLGQRLLRRAVLQRLEKLNRGKITLIDAEGCHSFGEYSEAFPLQATVHIHDPRCYRQIALRGSIGAGEAYMAGDWSCDDLTALIRIMVLNREVMDGLEESLAWLAKPFLKAFHALHPNTRAGSRANIAAHYDLGNDFYRLFLDQSLMYSCGIFENEHTSLEEASLAKIDRICRKLQLNAADHLLEIGTGWGGFALHAAGRYGCRVTTTTISEKQYELARQRVREAGLEDRIEVLLEDYRDLKGSFDKLVSIEMIEAVGYRFFETYFRMCSRLLKPQGMMLLQAITIADQEYERASRSVDFIQRYIFPGGCLPSVTAMTNEIARVTDLRLFHLEDIGPHYAATLHHWRERFLTNLDRVRALGFSESFIRQWEFYLCYCEGGFAERTIGTVQMLFTKPLCRREPVLPELG